MAAPSAAERPFPKPRGLVNDFADVIPDPYKQKINGIVYELLQKTDIPVVVVTMPDIGGAEYTDYANRLYSTWGIGKKGEDKGVLIFITVKERKLRIETGYGLEGILPDGLVGEIRDGMTPFLKKDQFGEGLLYGSMAISQIIAKDAGVTLTGQVPSQVSRNISGKRKSRVSVIPLIIFFLIFMGIARRRGGSWWFFLPLLLGGGRGYGSGGGFGGFSGGFGGFGGGMSGGGGAGGSF